MTIDKLIWENFISKCRDDPQTLPLIPALEIMFNHEHPLSIRDEQGNMLPCSECVDKLLKALLSLSDRNVL